MYELPLIWLKIRDYVTAGLAGLLLITSIGWYIADLNLDKEKLGRKNDKVQFEKGMEEAKAAHLKEKIEKEAKFNELKKEQEQSYSALLSKYNASLLRYKANTNTASRSNLSIDPGSPSASEGDTEDSFVPVLMSDLLICAENTAKTVLTYDWLNELDKIK